MASKESPSAAASLSVVGVCIRARATASRIARREKIGVATTAAKSATKNPIPKTNMYSTKLALFNFPEPGTSLHNAPPLQSQRIAVGSWDPTASGGSSGWNRDDPQPLSRRARDDLRGRSATPGDRRQARRSSPWNGPAEIIEVWSPALPACASMVSTRFGMLSSTPPMSVRTQPPPRPAAPSPWRWPAPRRRR